MMSDGSFRPQISQQQPFQTQSPQFPYQQPQSMPMQPQYPSAGVQQQQSFLGQTATANLPPAPTVNVPTTAASAPAPTSAIAGPTSSVGQSNPEIASFHPIARARALMIDLKQSLQVVMKAGSDATKEQVIGENAGSSEDASTETKPSTGAIDEFRQSLRAFDSICDQIEANFMVMQDLHREQVAGDKYTPAYVSPSSQKPDDAQEGPPNRPLLTYKEYEELTKLQTQFTNAVRESFLECGRLMD